MAGKQTYEVVARKELPSEVAVRIVQHYACFAQPKEVVERIKEEFGLELEPFQTYAWDPARPAGKDLPQDLITIHEETRQRYKESTGNIAIASQTYRLEQLQRMYDRAVLDEKPKLQLEIITAAAKETGGVFTRQVQVEHTLPAGASIAAPVINVTFSGPPLKPNEINITPRISTASTLTLEAGEDDDDDDC